MDNVILKIADICFADLKGTTPYHCAMQILEINKPETAPFSLKRLALKALFTESLKDALVVREVHNFLLEERSRYHNNPSRTRAPRTYEMLYLEGNLDVFFAALVTMNTASELNLCMTIKNSKCTLSFGKTIIIEVKEDLQWIHNTLYQLIEKKASPFIVVVKDPITEHETYQKKFERIMSELPQGSSCTQECYLQQTFHFREQTTVIFQRTTCRCWTQTL